MDLGGRCILGPEDVAKLEFSKLATELNQLRNQQFQITLAALAFFGVGLSVLLPGTLLNGQPGAAINAWLVLGMQLILGVLFYWLRGLSIMLARISVYLQLRFCSVWEVDHTVFDRESRSPWSVVFKVRGRASQRRMMAGVFACLGLFVPACALLSHLSSYPISSTPGWLLLGLGSAAYALWIGILGRSELSDRGGASEHWQLILKSKPGTQHRDPEGQAEPG